MLKLGKPRLILMKVGMMPAFLAFQV